MLLLCGVIFEFLNIPPYRIIPLDKTPEVYRWLAEQPRDTIIAEFPLDAIAPNPKYMFFQTKHHKSMINGTIPGTSPNVEAKTLTRLSDLTTLRVLQKWNVRYILIHPSAYEATGLIEDTLELEKILKSPHLKRVKEFSDTLVCAIAQ